YFSNEKFEAFMAPPQVQEFTTLQAFNKSMEPASLDPITASQDKERGVIGKSFDFVTLMLRETQRVEKGMFAGFDAWLKGASSSDAFDIAKDELASGFMTGNFKRDVTGVDLLKTGLGITEEEFTLLGSKEQLPFATLIPGSPGFVGNIRVKTALEVSGFAIDVLADPFNLVPVTRIARTFGAATKGIGGLISKGIGKVPVAGPMKDQLLTHIVGGFKSAFIKPIPATAAGKAAEQGIIRSEALTAEVAEGVVDNFIREGRAWKKLVKESGKTDQELGTLITEAAGTIKINDPTLLPEALNDTYARIYKDYGLEGWDEFVKSGGLRLIPDEEPLRRAIFNGKFDEANEALQEAMSKDLYGDLKSVVFDMKERQLDRFVFQRQNVRRTSKITDPVFESLSRDYVRIAATKSLRDAIELLGLGPKTSVGFGLNPFSTSNLHSKLQEIGVDAANTALRTPKNPRLPFGKSEFFVINPVS
ncbi:hypothetical protein LCGC14_2567030, partial [marine sediment metagenome]